MNAYIIPLSEEFRINLADYMHRRFPTYTDAFIKYDINEAIEGNVKQQTSIIVIDDNRNIVGCHLCFNTKAWIHGKEETVMWGHDTYLDEEYRKFIGMDFVLEIMTIRNGFGIGLTEINTKIHKLIRTIVFVDGLRKFCFINPWIIWRKALSFLRLSPTTLSLPLAIHIKKESFIQCKTPKDILIPNEGYWNKDICEVDFIRDEEFLNKRFFQNPVHHYYVYTLRGQNCYFVLRPVLFKGILALMVVDFRYDYTKPELVKYIFEAVHQVCNNKRLGAILFTTNDENVKNMFNNNKMCKSYPVAFVGGKKNITSKESIIFLTAADSDDEFHK